MPRLLAIGIAAVVLVCALPQVEAQKEARQARRLLRSGDRHRDKGDRLRERGDEEKALAEFEAALVDYQQAYELVANPALFYPIGQIEERLGMDLEALAHYRKVLEETDTLPDDLRAEIELRIDGVRERLAVISFQVEPEGALIEVDGMEIGEAPLAAAREYIPGELAIKVSKEGYKPYEETREFDAGETTVEIFLEKKVKTVTVVPDPEPPPEPEPPKTPEGRNHLIAGAATTGGLAITAVITGILAQQKHGDFEDPNLSPPERESARDSGQTLAFVTDLLWIGTIAAGSYTAYYYYTTYKPNQERAERRAAASAAARGVWVSPFATGESAGVAVGGSF